MKLGSRILLIDFLGAMLSGICIGYLRHRLADSGELHTDKMLFSMLLATASFAFAFWIVRLWTEYSRGVRTWGVAAVLGSIICSFSLHVALYAVHNLRYKGSRSSIEYILWILPSMIPSFLFAAFVYSVIAFFMMGALHTLMSRRLVNEES